MLPIMRICDVVSQKLDFGSFAITQEVDKSFYMKRFQKVSAKHLAKA